MKPILYAGVAAVTIAAASFANAQSVGVGVGPVGVDVDFAPEQRTVIREYVTRERVRPIELRERVAVGATLPADVEISTVPAEWGPAASRYRYVYSVTAFTSWSHRADASSIFSTSLHLSD